MEIIRGSKNSAFMNLPSELLLHIAGFLYDDREALHNLALLSRRLSAIARHELFKVMDIRALEEDYMEQYLHLVRELRAVPPFDHYADLLGAHALHKLTPRNLPRLRALSLAELNLVRTSWVCQKDFHVLGSLPSITTLSLSRVEFFQPVDMLAVICYLPHITVLSLNRVTIRGVDTPDLTAIVTNPAPTTTFDDAVERVKTRPQLARLALDVNLMAMHVARWLADAPSALTTLAVDPTASDAQFMLPHFGPTIVHLAVPLRSTGPLARESAHALALHTHSHVILRSRRVDDTSTPVHGAAHPNALHRRVPVLRVRAHVPVDAAPARPAAGRAAHGPRAARHAHAQRAPRGARPAPARRRCVLVGARPTRRRARGARGRVHESEDGGGRGGVDDAGEEEDESGFEGRCGGGWEEDQEADGEAGGFGEVGCEVWGVARGTCIVSVLTVLFADHRVCS